MALPSIASQISLGMIYNELTGSFPTGGSNRSLNTCESGGYATINNKSVNRPDGVTPNRISEWALYDHSAVIGLPDAYITISAHSSGMITASLSRQADGLIEIVGSYNNYYGSSETFHLIISQGNNYDSHYDSLGLSISNVYVQYVSFNYVADYSSPTPGMMWRWIWTNYP